tara:strand:+ start:717 stop:1346 length:630 start_codon:yes stop_codon:yes gene_type:complete
MKILLCILIILIVILLFTNNNKKVEHPTIIINQQEEQPIVDPQETNSLDRIYNPVRFPYKTVPYFNEGLYPNMMLPSNVIGCGRRGMPCLGGTQIPIRNYLPSLNVSESSIAPINIRTRGPRGVPQQVGSLSRILSNHNEIYPLFGRKKFPNDTKWDYYTILDNGVKIPVIRKHNNFEVGENDNITLKGKLGVYSVSLYDDDFPQYIPY